MEKFMFDRKFNVRCTGQKENQLILKRLRELGYSYANGELPDPEKVRYSSYHNDEDDKKIYSASYAINPITKNIAYNSYISAMNPEFKNIYNASLEEFLEFTEDQVAEKLNHGNRIYHVICVGRQQNMELLKRLHKKNFSHAGGMKVQPWHLHYTAEHIDEDGATHQAAVYAIDEELKLVALHDSMSILKLEQSKDRVVSAENYLSLTSSDSPPPPFQFKRWKELG